METGNTPGKSGAKRCLAKLAPFLVASLCSAAAGASYSWNNHKTLEMQLVDAHTVMSQSEDPDEVDGAMLLLSNAGHGIVRSIRLGEKRGGRHAAFARAYLDDLETEAGR